MSEGAFQKRWNPAHAAACLVAGGSSALSGSPWPLAVTGTASLVAFFVLARPRQGRLGVGLANLVTLIRLLLLFGVATFAPTPWGFVLVLVLDALDGVLARRLGQTSPFGAHFDMETDALFIALLSVEALRLGAAPAVLLAGALRPLLVLARQAPRPGPARPPGERRSFFGRFAFLLSALLLIAAIAPLPPLARAVLASAAVVVLLVSFAGDFASLRRG